MSFRGALAGYCCVAWRLQWTRVISQRHSCCPHPLPAPSLSPFPPRSLLMLVHTHMHITRACRPHRIPAGGGAHPPHCHQPLPLQRLVAEGAACWHLPGQPRSRRAACCPGSRRPTAHTWGLDVGQHHLAGGSCHERALLPCVQSRHAGSAGAHRQAAWAGARQGAWRVYPGVRSSPNRNPC